MTGQVGGRPFSVHAEGERVILTGSDGRREVDLVPPATPAPLPEPICPVGVINSTLRDGLDEPLAPGESGLDEGLEQLGFKPADGSEP
jgi:hypothetical protein